ncbi:hypothetical protein PUNSTDRAFT_47579 [Punctularia strigosozonata HHB-11173 SS5]|uniref:Uncharacterized protein n=1 Tax=Punctularia strigosozonata (strain HHB-11173) TaxID=741275 RepID=R7S3G0_PUNST|nr:uncharacterized protein PUNSTDRAFT_47579 [Punctularia strigosozonata HHB-11173 SS5]EIN04332.1 hypothetical protein PUNSTDRAFT_47579 [Punctularia strigosozonata HHB-11173 SS5]
MSTSSAPHLSKKTEARRPLGYPLSWRTLAELPFTLEAARRDLEAASAGDVAKFAMLEALIDMSRYFQGPEQSEAIRWLSKKAKRLIIPQERASTELAMERERWRTVRDEARREVAKMRLIPPELFIATEESPGPSQSLVEQHAKQRARARRAKHRNRKSCATPDNSGGTSTVVEADEQGDSVMEEEAASSSTTVTVPVVEISPVFESPTALHDSAGSGHFEPVIPADGLKDVVQDNTDNTSNSDMGFVNPPVSQTAVVQPAPPLTPLARSSVVGLSGERDDMDVDGHSGVEVIVEDAPLGPPVSVQSSPAALQQELLQSLATLKPSQDYVLPDPIMPAPDRPYLFFDEADSLFFHGAKRIKKSSELLELASKRTLNLFALDAYTMDHHFGPFTDVPIYEVLIYLDAVLPRSAGQGGVDWPNAPPFWQMQLLFLFYMLFPDLYETVKLIRIRQKPSLVQRIAAAEAYRAPPRLPIRLKPEQYTLHYAGTALLDGSCFTDYMLDRGISRAELRRFSSAARVLVLFMVKKIVHVNFMSDEHLRRLEELLCRGTAFDPRNPKDWHNYAVRELRAVGMFTKLWDASAASKELCPAFHCEIEQERREAPNAWLYGKPREFREKVPSSHQGVDAMCRKYDGYRRPLLMAEVGEPSNKLQYGGIKMVRPWHLGAESQE